MLVAATLVFASASAAQADRQISLDKSTQTRCVEILREALHADEFWPSMHAAEALTLAGYQGEVREFLEPKLATEDDLQHRCGLARELVRAGDKLKRHILLDILAGDDDYGHIHAAESSYKVSEIGDGVAMRRAFAQDENPILKIMAAAALGRCGNPESLPYLRETLQHDDPAVARIAAWVLGRIGEASDISRLREKAKTIDDPADRSWYEHSLAALGDPSGLAALKNNLDSDDATVRTYAAVFAGDARAVGAADRLKQLLDDEILDIRVRAAQTLLVLTQSEPPNPDEDISQIVFEATEQNPRYTEGSVLELADGSLLCATTEFIGSDSDFAKARIVARRSTDEGRTWGDPRVLQENTGGLNVMSVTLRRLKHGPHAGQVAMFYLQKNDFNDLDMLLRFSQDEAESFGEPILVTPEPGYHVVNNDRVTELSTGRLLVPAASTPDVKTDNHFKSHCFISDDGGLTWHKGAASVDMPKRGAMEPEVVELNDGRVLMIVRTQLGIIGAAHSDDEGETWGEPFELSVKAPEAPSTLRRIPATGDLVLIWNNTFEEGAGHGGKRTPLTAAVSSDEGQTWRNIRNLESDKTRTYSYVSLIFVRGRAVMSYWDNTGSRYSLRFRSIPAEWFYAEK